MGIVHCAVVTYILSPLKNQTFIFQRSIDSLFFSPRKVPTVYMSGCFFLKHKEFDERALSIFAPFGASAGMQGLLYLG
jgi:hypothetical protein